MKCRCLSVWNKQGVMLCPMPMTLQSSAGSPTHIIGAPKYTNHKRYDHIVSHYIVVYSTNHIEMCLINSEKIIT